MVSKGVLSFGLVIGLKELLRFGVGGTLKYL